MESIFKNDANCSVCFWAWNSEITEEEIEFQMSDFADGRIGGVVIHARAGLKIPYMGERWMQLFKFAVEKANEFGLEVWIYDEDGWPSGFASGSVPSLGEEYCFKRLKYDYAKNIDFNNIECEKIVAVYQKRAYKYERLKKYLVADLYEDDIVFWYTIDNHYVDLLNPKVTDAFIDFTHERYKAIVGDYFGKVVKGFFTDEPQLNGAGYVWSETLLEEYKKITNKDLIDDLWMVAIKSSEAYSFRYKLWSIISDLYLNNFVKRISGWCENNNLKQTGHFPAEDGLIVQLSACGEVMRNYSCMQLPAIDHLGSRVASPVLMKQVSSVSRQYGDGNVLSETFGCAGWGVTFRRLQWIWGGQSVLGVTKPCYHLSSYSMEGRRKRDYPAFYSYQEPWWDDFRSFSLWMSNLNSLMSEGERDLHTLVIPPMSGLKYLYDDGNHRTDVMKNLSSEYRCLLENLIDLQLDFDLGDETLICNDAIVSNGKITLGKISYDTIILSKTPVITPQFYSILEEFVNAGGCVLGVDLLPKSFTNGEKCNLEQLVKYVLPNRRNTIEKYLENMGVCRSVTVARVDNLKPISNISLHTRTTPKGKIIHIWPNEDFMSGNAYLRFEIDAMPYKVNLIDNSREPLVRLVGKDDYLVPITINKEENLVVELIKGAESAADDYSLLKILNINDLKITTYEKNCITLDHASVSIDGGCVFGEQQQILKILDFIYSQKRTTDLNVVLRYCFKCDNIDLSNVTVALEDKACLEIKVNGNILSKTRKSWWIDHSIGVFDIGELLRTGENFIDLYYKIPFVRSEKEISNEFETEKNRFYYPCEPDCIYIIGDFDVSNNNAKIYNNGYCYQTGADFRLVKPTPKKIGDLTTQGMWFYRGNVSYDFFFDIEDNFKRIILTVEDYNGTMISLKIGKKRVVSHSCPARFDVTDMVTSGENFASIELIGNNRNLLGPHHHIKGETYIVCPASFEGSWDELAELLSPELYCKDTLVKDYGFIAFGVNDIKLEIYN